METAIAEFLREHRLPPHLAEPMRELIGRVASGPGAVTLAPAATMDTLTLSLPPEAPADEPVGTSRSTSPAAPATGLLRRIGNGAARAWRAGWLPANRRGIPWRSRH